MNERYKKLYTLTENLYAEGSPVIISAGALLLDTKIKGVLAQLKFRSISKKIIVALKAEITSYDDAGRVLGEPLSYKYLDLNAEIDTEFGSKTPVSLPDATTRKISVKVTEVIFKDTSFCDSFGSEWNELLAPRSLIDALGADMAREFELKYGSKCIFEACRRYDLWYCTCGAINKTEDNVCHVCRSKLSVLENVDFDVLRDRCEKRLEAEKQEREKKRLEAEEAQRKKAERLQAKRKKIKKLCILGITAATITLAFILTLTLWVIPNSRYRAALKEMDKGNYSIAINKFSELDGYKNSEELIEECRKANRELSYQKALTLMEQGRYREAISIFGTLGDYKDSGKNIYSCEEAILNEQLATPLALIEQKKYEEAYNSLTKLSKEYDVSDYLARFSIKPSTQKSYNSSNELVSATYYIYDDNGNLQTEKVNGYLGNSTSDFYSYEYDNNNRCIRKNHSTFDYSVYNYDKKGLCVRKEFCHTSDNKMYAYCVYEYDSNNYLVKDTFYNDSNTAMSYTLYTNDSTGRVIKEETYNIGNDTPSIREYEYDANGNIIKSVSLDRSGDEWIYTYEYEDFLYFYNP